MEVRQKAGPNSADAIEGISVSRPRSNAVRDEIEADEIQVCGCIEMAIAAQTIQAEVLRIPRIGPGLSHGLSHRVYAQPFERDGSLVERSRRSRSGEFDHMTSVSKTARTDDTTRQALETPTDLGGNATAAIAAELNKVAADAFALYVKTKNFHWHMSGPHFRDYHLLLDEQGSQIFATIDPLAERSRKLGQPTLHSIGNIAKLSRIKDNDAEFVSPADMLDELLADNKTFTSSLRAAHKVAGEHSDSATTSVLEVYIDESERRTWFLFEASRGSDRSGH